MGEVRVRGEVVEVRLSDGATARVKPVSRSRNNDLVGLAGIAGENDTAGQLRYQELLVRAAIVGAEGLVDDEGKPVEFKTERLGGGTAVWGASRAVFDAIHGTQDLVKIVEVANSRMRLGEGAAGN